jgi:hypothetical protein
MKLQNLEFYKEVEGFTFDDLPRDLRNALTIRPYLRVVTLLKQSDPNLKYEVFTRLNTGGDPLLPQEIRNVVFRGPLNNLIYQLSSHPFLKQQLKITSETSKAYKEMLDAEYVLRFFTLKEYWNNFPGNVRKAMDTFMMQNRDASANKINAWEAAFNNSIQAAQAIWGNQAFIRPDGNHQIVQGFFDIQMVPLSLISTTSLSKLIQNKDKFKSSFLKKYNVDPEFNESIRQFTSNPKNVEYRIKTMLDIISFCIK